MLYGVSIGPGDPKLLTVRAVEVIREADEVIVPGKLAERVVREYRRDVRVVEFPMGRADEVVAELSEELAERCVSEDVAFCALGDVMFFSTFQDIFREVRRRNPSAPVEMIPGVPSFTAVFSKIGVFVDAPLRMVTQDEWEERFVVVMKAKNSGEIAEKLEELGFRVVEAEKMYMDGEYIGKPKEKSSYFTLVVGWR
ncbi:MAG: precorrin-2 C(20)-methyltransferase [Archaeoglobi archaeon]|nr:precorrin-2 C(20)-methyltransferase [Archaeoglobi archaeon]